MIVALAPASGIVEITLDVCEADGTRNRYRIVPDQSKGVDVPDDIAASMIGRTVGEVKAVE